MTTDALHDKKGIPIMKGDVVKVLHFIGARNKKHYMYKQCVAQHRWTDGSFYLEFSHLDMTSSNYYMGSPADTNVLEDYEIVQSADSRFETRQRLAV